MSESAYAAQAASNGTQTLAFVASTLPKEQRDLAFAAQILSQGLVTERQLRAAVADWSVYGATPLADHLQAAGLVSSADRERIEAAASAALAELHAEPAESGVSGLTSTLRHFDATGRVARLLGISADADFDVCQFRLGNLRLTLARKLGQGGLGTVWLARDENLQRYVALKEISAGEEASSAAASRFRREAEITGRLEHPGIVPVYQFGEDRATGRAFYTMRFLGKQTLQDVVAEYHERREAGDHDPMLLRNLLTAFVSVCQAVGHAHSRKVVHRDLKPENVAIDSFGQVIVLDWGLAKVLDETGLADRAEVGHASGGDSQGTAVGQVLGTPLYMAPEQAAGRIDAIDERTDIYGLGATLFAILTGSAPHERSMADSSTTGGRGLIAAIAGRPTPLARSVNPDVDPALEAVCARAMAKRPYARYQSATELAEELQRWMAGEPIRAYRTTRREQVGLWVRRHSRLSQALATLAIAALITGVTLLANAYEHRESHRRARFEEARSLAREIDAHFVSTLDHLSRNTRFMANIPPVYGIMAARGAKPDAAAENEDTWRGRADQIYEGLLRANRTYLNVAYLSYEEGEGDLRELARVERRATDVHAVRRAPKGRLASRKSDALLEEVRKLDPGEVRLALVVAPDGRAGARPRLFAAVPVYDEAKGTVFGVVTVESDGPADAVHTLESLTVRQTEIFVTDARGQVWVSARPGSGVLLEAGTRNALDLVPACRPLFEPDGDDTLVLPREGVVAGRVRLNPLDRSISYAVVLRVVD